MGDLANVDAGNLENDQTNGISNKVIFSASGKMENNFDGATGILVLVIAVISLTWSCCLKESSRDSHKRNLVKIWKWCFRSKKRKATDRQAKLANEKAEARELAASGRYWTPKERSQSHFMFKKGASLNPEETLAVLDEKATPVAFSHFKPGGWDRHRQRMQVAMGKEMFDLHTAQAEIERSLRTGNEKLTEANQHRAAQIARKDREKESHEKEEISPQLEATIVALVREGRLADEVARVARAAVQRDDERRRSGRRERGDGSYAPPPTTRPPPPPSAPPYHNGYYYYTPQSSPHTRPRQSAMSSLPPGYAVPIAQSTPVRKPPNSTENCLSPIYAAGFAAGSEVAASFTQNRGRALQAEGNANAGSQTGNAAQGGGTGRNEEEQPPGVRELDPAMVNQLGGGNV